MQCRVTRYCGIVPGQMRMEHGHLYRVTLDIASRGTPHVTVILRHDTSLYTLYVSSLETTNEEMRTVSFVSCGPSDPWLLECPKLNASYYCDAISVHGCDATIWSTVTSPERLVIVVSNMPEELQAAGPPDTPVWDIERGASVRLLWRMGDSVTIPTDRRDSSLHVGPLPYRARRTSAPEPGPDVPLAPRGIAP